MESYRDSFRAQSGLDPIRLGRHAAALGPRNSHSPHHRRAGLQGRAGLRHGWAELHLPALRSSQQPDDYNPEEPVSWISYLDFNAMYPAAMTLPMPNGPCVAVALPEDNAARLSWLHERDVPLEPELGVRRRELHDHLDWAPPARMKVGKGLYGPHTADMAERLGLSPSPCKKLVPFLGTHVGKRLKFLRDVLGARVWRLHRAYRFACSPFMAGFMELKHSERRQLKTAGSVVAEKVVKLTQRCCMNPDKFRNTNAYVDPAKFERAVGKSSVPNSSWRRSRRTAARPA